MTTLKELSATIVTEPIKRIALVTGASRGIGFAIARQLALDGFTVIGTATTVMGADSLTDTFLAEKLPVIGKVLQVEDITAIQDLLVAIEAEYGAVTVLVNNAGITRDQLLMRMKEADWQDVLNVNLNAVYALSKGVLKGMSKARFGRIINITSVVAQMGNIGQANYAAAKAGVEGFSRALAVEMGSRSITVNCVAPGFIDTDMTSKLDGTIQQQMLSKIPLARLGTPVDIAKTVSFLASEGASYITGAVIPVNGGMFLG